MLIEIATVGSERKSVSTVFDPRSFELGSDLQLTSDVLVNADIWADDDGVHIAGTVTTTLESPCSRCLEAVKIELVRPFDDVFVESFSEADSVELAIDELDASVITDGSIDLKEVVREQILLAVPEQPLCRSGCKGLCEICGADLNENGCECGTEIVDPRWSALKSLKEDLN